MLPIAVMPLAALLLRLGQEDLLGVPFIAAAGEAIFKNFGILFAVGVAVGFAKETHGAAALAGAVGYFVTITAAGVLVKLPPDIVALTGDAHTVAATKFHNVLTARISIPVGILSGLIAGAVYNRFKDAKLPDALAFFGGRRFVPILTGFLCLGLAYLFGVGWPYLTAGLDALSRAMVSAGEIGLFLYGVLNRLLLITGLHHIINNIAWFILGDYNGQTGDLNRFFAGDPTAGAFMAGFFPVMMFGLPAACLAMYRAALPENRRAVAGVLFSMALTSFLTGITEPVEFAFMFLAPMLFVAHALLTGLALVIMSLLDVKLGFGFSAGLFDYVINYNKSTNPILLLPVGAAYFAVYYGVFRWVIARFDLKTLGREPGFTGVQDVESGAPLAAAPLAAAPLATARVVPTGSAASQRGAAYLAALGGGSNVLEVEACATRLRLLVVDNTKLDEQALKALGARGVLRPAAGAAQVIIGPLADQIGSEIQDAMKATTPSS